MWLGEEDEDTGRKVKKFSSREKPVSFKPGESESVCTEE